MQRILVTGEPLINKTEKQIATDGKEIWASVTKVPIYSQSGTITGVVGLSRDITRLKQTEQALRQAEGTEEEQAEIISSFFMALNRPVRDAERIAAVH